jgi:hypothetical protein
LQESGYTRSKNPKLDLNASAQHWRTKWRSCC